MLILFNVSVQAANLQFKVEGLHGEILRNTHARLQALLQLAPTQTENEIQQLYNQALEQIRLAIQPYGYYQPVIQAHLQNNTDNWLATYQVKLGPRITINSIQLKITGEGQNNPKLQYLRRHFALKPGQPLLAEAYTQAKVDLITAAEEQGYLSAAWSKHRIIIKPSDHSAQILLTLATGIRYQFGKIKLSPSPLSSSLLYRYIPFQAGQPYSAQQLLTLQDNLAGSPYFKHVNVTPEFIPGQQQIPVTIDLEPQRPNLYQLGIGYGTDTGPRGSLGWQRRYVNAQGHTLNVNLTGSDQQNNLQFNYNIPGLNPITDQYTLTSNMTNNQYKQGESHTQQVGVGFITYLDDWQKTLALNFQRERFRFDNQSYTGSRLLIPAMTWQYRQLDKPVNPSRGKRISLKIQGAEKTFLSDTRFIQVETQGKYLFPCKTNSRFITRFEAGYTSVHDLNSLPFSLRFYTGGTQSIRGFQYQELGPGRYKAIGSIEYQHALKDGWYLASFYDIGNAWEKLTSNPSSSRTSKLLQQGAGFGLVWRSPVGALQLSLGKALTKKGQPMQLQFSMEPEL
jgi:translocation and assembly module TamA